jgi:hypothetical protein
MPYSPLHEPQKHVTQEDMWEKLARNTKPQAQVSNAAQSPKAKVSLQWNPPVWTSSHGPLGSGYLLTACGRFTVSKDAHELGFTYSAWRRHPDMFANGKRYKEMPEPLGCCRTSDEAKQLCEAAQ